jgi:hypothetical protein
VTWVCTGAGGGTGAVVAAGVVVFAGVGTIEDGSAPLPECS